MTENNTQELWFTRFDGSNAPANRLHVEVRKLLESSSNRLVRSKDWQVGWLMAGVAKLNEEFPKCRPLEVKPYGINGDAVRISLGEHFVVNYTIYKVKNAAMFTEAAWSG